MNQDVPELLQLLSGLHFLSPIGPCVWLPTQRCDCGAHDLGVNHAIPRDVSRQGRHRESTEITGHIGGSHLEAAVPEHGESVTRFNFHEDRPCRCVHERWVSDEQLHIAAKVNDVVHLRLAHRVQHAPCRTKPRVFSGAIETLRQIDESWNRQAGYPPASELEKAARSAA